MDKYTQISITDARNGNAAFLRALCRRAEVVIVTAQGHGRILSIQGTVSMSVPIDATVVGWSEFRTAKVSDLLDWTMPVVVLVYGDPAFVVERWNNNK